MGPEGLGEKRQPWRKQWLLWPRQLKVMVACYEQHSEQSQRQSSSLCRILVEDQYSW